MLVNYEDRVRSALRLVLTQEPDLNVVGEAANALNMLSCMRFALPDVLLLDWELPGLGNPELLHAIRFLYPNLRVIVLSPRPEAEGEAMSAGAAAFVSKCDPPEALISTLRGLSTRPD